MLLLNTISIMEFLIFIIIPLALGMWAQMRISSVYSKYAKVGSRHGLTGREAADAVMRNAGIHDVEIAPTQGKLTDHYDPSKKRLVLSEDNYYGHSLAALGVAAHEAGHAIQHKANYPALKLRMGLVPVTMFASQLLPFVMIGGFFLGILGLVHLGVIIYLILTVFQLVTLPVEFDASKRAKEELVGLGIIAKDEMPGVSKTLNAAAWTYVAAFIASLGNLLYLLMLSRSRH